MPHSAGTPPGSPLSPMDQDVDFALSPPESDSEYVDMGPNEARPHDRPASHATPDLLQHATSTVTKLLREKGKEWDEVASRKGPLTLLELPVDILRLIVKEIMHTNDLTSLALTNSTLHSLAVPHIYARFDIVWPDAPAASSDHKSVDALTYGLSTLSLGSSFSRLRQRLLRSRPFRQSSAPFDRLGNNYAIHTRKFSLGNGPQDWVSAYMINREGGKMLGTLVAMAVAKMVNLETFVWDMPTGVLAEIFLALASLPDSSSDGQCSLEKVWIRWHDNSEGQMGPPGPGTGAPARHPNGSIRTPIGVMLPGSVAHPKPRPAIPYSASSVEYPTFSVLPPLSSLTVLDIDELAYLDEISMLIERSQDKLQELRIGISDKAQSKDFVEAWDGPGLHQVDHEAHWPGGSTIGERRLGGVLGVLVGRIYDIRRRQPTRLRGRPGTTPASRSDLAPGGAADDDRDGEPLAAFNSVGQPYSPSPSDPDSSKRTGTPRSTNQDHYGQTSAEKKSSKTRAESISRKDNPGRPRLEGKLRLHTLELEGVPLSMQVCSRAIDWTTLTTLTVLNCAQHETLWQLLKREYQPSAACVGASSSRAGREYFLSLKNIRTDMTSPSLISFLTEVLAPNTLEVLFLQDRRSRSNAQPAVSIEMIFKGPLRRHRSSLRQLLLDSSSKNIKSDSSVSEIDRWRYWVPSSRILHFMTSGRMGNLRELAISMAYNDWHNFLQRLPNIPQLRSLNIPHIADHEVPKITPKELALQIADIITLRPEIQLCYIGISTQCFEILESMPGERGSYSSNNGTGSDNVSGSNGDAAANNAGGQQQDVEAFMEQDSDDEDQPGGSSDEEDGGDTEEEDGGMNTQAIATDDGHSDGHTEENGWSSDEEDGFIDPDYALDKKKLRLREILFYDDKVAIFKARHGRL